MPIEFEGLNAFAMFLGAGAARAAAAEAAAARATAEALAVAARELYGQDPPLEELAPATQEERVSLGFSANEPLLRNGALLRDSVRPYATATIGGIISEEPIAAYHEFGYVTTPFGNPRAEPVSVPPRPVFRYALQMVEPFVLRQGGFIVRNVLGMGLEAEL